MFWNVKTWQLHSGHWRYWETRAKVQELTFWGHFKMKWILISNSKQYIWPFLFEWMPRMSSVSPECRGAGTWGNVLHICQLSGGDQRQVTACNTSYHPASTIQPSALSTRTQLMVQAITRDTQKLDISLFLVLVESVMRIETQAACDAVWTQVFSVSVTAILSHPSLACLGLKWTKIFEGDKKYFSLCAHSCHVPVSVSSVPMVQWSPVSMSAEMTTCCLLLTTRWPSSRWLGRTDRL